MILAFAMKNPQMTASAIDNYNAPGQVEVAKLQESVADFAMQTLVCYHKTARFRGVEVLNVRWSDQSKYGADSSIVMRINLGGISGSAYQMVVAAMAKGNAYRTFVINENTMVPYNKKCALESWTAAEASE
jgi:hypothetical protein